MRNHKEQAEIYRYGLPLGLFEVSDVVKWCDFIVMAEPSPDIGIIEASIAGSKGAYAVASALSEVQGEFDKVLVIRHILGAMYEVLRVNRTKAPLVARLLYRMASDNDFPDDDTETEMWRFWDEVDLAVEGIHGDVEEVTDDLLRFLKRYSVTASTK